MIERSEANKAFIRAELDKRIAKMRAGLANEKKFEPATKEQIEAARQVPEDGGDPNLDDLYVPGFKMPYAASEE